MTSSQITMGTIDAITDFDGCDWHHNCEVPKCSRDKCPSNATRRAVAISLGATRRSCQRMQQRHHEDVVSIMTILIPQQQSSSKEHQLPQHKCDKRNQEPGDPLNGKPHADWAYSCLRSPVARTTRSTTKHAMKNLQKTKKHSQVTLAPHVTRATLTGPRTQTINWHHPKLQRNKCELPQKQQRRKSPSSFW